MGAGVVINILKTTGDLRTHFCIMIESTEHPDYYFKYILKEDRSKVKVIGKNHFVLHCANYTHHPNCSMPCRAKIAILFDGVWGLFNLPNVVFEEIGYRIVHGSHASKHCLHSTAEYFGRQKTSACNVVPVNLFHKDPAMYLNCVVYYYLIH